MSNQIEQLFDVLTRYFPDASRDVYEIAVSDIISNLGIENTKEALGKYFSSASDEVRSQAAGDILITLGGALAEKDLDQEIEQLMPSVNSVLRKPSEPIRG